MFGVVLILLVTLMHGYVFWRAASVPFVKRYASVRILAGVGVVLWLGFFLGRVVGHGGSGPAAKVLEAAGMSWMVVLFLMAVCLLAADLATAFGFFMSRKAPSIRGLALITGLALSMVAQVQGLRAPEVNDYEVYLPGLPPEMDGKVLVALSDLHVGAQLGIPWLKERVAQVLALRPDLVVLLGDLFEGHGLPREDLLSVLKGLSAPLGVWAVPGNHEFYGSGGAILGLIKTSGIRVLSDEWAEIVPGCVLAGVEDLTMIQREGREDDPLAETLAMRPPGATILLSHTPWKYDEAAAAGVGLMLSGHTHGGQIWPFGYIVRLTYPLLAGRYEVGGMTVIVCRGTGSWGARMRLWQRSEILRVTLHAVKGSDADKEGRPLMEQGNG